AALAYSIASNRLSSSSAGNGQPKPFCTARCTVFVTAPFDRPVAAAIFSWLKRASNLRRRTSLILRMALRLAGIRLPDQKIGQLSQENVSSSAHSASFRPNVTDHSGNMTDDSGRGRKSVTFNRNRRSRSVGTTGHVQTESAVNLVRNAQLQLAVARYADSNESLSDARRAVRARVPRDHFAASSQCARDQVSRPTRSREAQPAGCAQHAHAGRGGT